MQFSGLEAQIFIGVAVILGCAFVALLCDYLKGVNERLRERALELTVRLEETERWGRQVMALQQAVRPEAEAPAEAPEPASANTALHDTVKDELVRLHREVEQVSRSVASLAELRVAMGQPAAISQPVTLPAEQPAPLEEPVLAAVAQASPAPVTFAEAPAPPLQPVAPPEPPAPAAVPFVAHVPEPVPVAQAPAAPQALPKLNASVGALEDLISRFAEKTPAPEPVAEATPRPSVMKIRVLRDTIASPAEPVPMPEPAPAPAQTSQATIVVPPVPAQSTVDIFTATASAPPKVVTAVDLPVPPPLPMSIPSNSELALPSGMHDRATLDFLRSDTSLFSGLVVAIGLNDFEQLRANVGAEAADDLVRSVAQLVKSLTSNLAGPQFFAAQCSGDEFVLAYNGEIGPAAQRRMAAVSERLWDFQLRSIGAYSVVFSWGASEANDEQFAEAIDAALERMRETRQNRKAMGGDKGRKRVVA